MHTILPINSAIIECENESELKDVFINISARNKAGLASVNEIGYITGCGFHQFYIQERQNILIVKYTGVVEESTEEIISTFYSVNGFNW